MRDAGSVAEWIVCPQPRPEARVRLLCIPYAGGGTNVYRAWRNLLPQEVELCLAQLPGREVRFKEPALDRAEPILEALASDLARLRRLPLVLFGHSMGALLAFELARRLEAEGGLGLAYLCVSGRAAPHLGDREPLHALPEEEFIRALRRLNGTPEEVFASAELMRLVLPVVRADLAVDETHAFAPSASVGCPVLALGGTRDALVSKGALEGWRTYARGAFRAAFCEGDHFFLNQNRTAVLGELAPVLSSVAERLS